MSFFSKLGENIILPQDVLIQSKETAAVVGAINATIGIATTNKKAMALPSINKVITEINNSEYLPYSPTPGLPKMRELWKEKILKDNPKINDKYLSLPMVLILLQIYLVKRRMLYFYRIYFGKTTHKYTQLN